MKLTKKQHERMIKEFGHIPTKEEIFAKMEASLARMNEALEGAWKTMPDDMKIRKDMTEVVARSAKLRQGVYQSLIKKPVPQKSVPSGKIKA